MVPDPTDNATGGKKPGVLQVIPELDAGGAERSCLEVATAVARAGWRSYVATRGGRMVRQLRKAGVEVFLLPVHSKNPVVMLENMGRLRAIIRERQIDVVHARSRAPAWSALAAAKAERVKFVTTYHGKVHDGPWWKVIYNSVMARGERVIANSNFTAARIRHVHGIGDDRLRVIARGFDHYSFHPDVVHPKRVAAMRAAWQIEDGGPPVVLLAGRLTRWKGQTLLLEAAAKLTQPFRIILAGDAQGRDDFVAELEALRAEKNLCPHVAIVGHVEDMPAAYLASDIVVSASLDPEPFGRVAVEAGAMGRCAIAPDHGGAKEQIVTAPEDARTGWLFAPGDADALAAALDTALALDAPARAAIGQRAHAFVSHAFSGQAMREKTLAVYREVLGHEVPGREVPGQ